MSVSVYSRIHGMMLVCVYIRARDVCTAWNNDKEG